MNWASQTLSRTKPVNEPHQKSSRHSSMVVEALHLPVDREVVFNGRPKLVVFIWRLNMNGLIVPINGPGLTVGNQEKELPQLLESNIPVMQGVPQCLMHLLESSWALVVGVHGQLISQVIPVNHPFLEGIFSLWRWNMWRYPVKTC